MRSVTIPKPPAALGKRGRRLWRALTTAYELSDSELEILAEASMTADLIDRLADQLAAEELVVEGSCGQTALHPDEGEIRQQRDLLARLLGRLALPGDEDAEDAAARLGRRGEAARWQRRIA